MADASDDHYDLLGVSRSADSKEIRQAYKKSALRWHPDKNPSDRARAELMFKKIARAYKVLMDPQQRASYDHGVAAGEKPSAPSSARANANATHPSAHAAPKAAASREQDAGNLWSPVGAVPYISINGTNIPCNQTLDGMEEAYSLFKDVFENDPFEEFDTIFKDPASADLGAFFGNMKRKLGGLNSKLSSFRRTPASVQFTSNRVTDQRVGSTAEHQSCQVSPSGEPLHRCGARVRCISTVGVAYRSCMDIASRVQHIRGPNCGDIVALQERSGDWGRSVHGWLPLVVDGEALFQILSDAHLVCARCLSPCGIAYRNSMSETDRLVGIHGPSYGDVVVVEERYGDWIRTSTGWLPLVLGGDHLLEIYDAVQPQQVSEPSWPRQQRRPDAAEFSSLMPLTLTQFRLLVLLGILGWVSLKTGKMLFRGWWHVAVSPWLRWF